MTSLVIYNGNLRTTCIHLASNREIITDAPVDNNGKGKAFSPTDLVATALGSCMLTIMGIKAANRGLRIENTRVEIEKIMESRPRRISEIKAAVKLPAGDFSEKEKALLERAALSCPVFLSLHADIKKSVHFEYS